MEMEIQNSLHKLKSFLNEIINFEISVDDLRMRLFNQHESKKTIFKTLD